MCVIFVYEMVTFTRKPELYTQSLWNWNDIFLCLLYQGYFWLSIADPKQAFALKAMQLVITISGFLKLS